MKKVDLNVQDKKVYQITQFQNVNIALLKEMSTLRQHIKKIYMISEKLKVQSKNNGYKLENFSIEDIGDFI